jgi:hypothetical protein
VFVEGPVSEQPEICFGRGVPVINSAGFIVCPVCKRFNDTCLQLRTEALFALLHTDTVRCSGEPLVVAIRRRAGIL